MLYHSSQTIRRRRHSLINIHEVNRQHMLTSLGRAQRATYWRGQCQLCLYVCHRLTGRIAHAQKLAKHMLCLLVALAPQMLCILLVNIKMRYLHNTAHVDLINIKMRYLHNTAHVDLINIKMRYLHNTAHVDLINIKMRYLTQ